MDESYEEKLKELRPIDDDFFKLLCNMGIAYPIIKIIKNKEYNVLSLEHQKVIKNIRGRSVIIDALLISDKIWIALEIERTSFRASPKRARLIRSVMDTILTHANMQFHTLPTSCVIFMTERDVFHKGKPIYHVKETIGETGEKHKSAEEVIYVNCSAIAEGLLGDLNHDMMCSDPNEMRLDFMREAASYYKYSKEGRRTMCKVFDEIRQEGIAEGKQQGILEGVLSEKKSIALNLLHKNIDINIISECSGLTVKEIQLLAA